MCHTHSSMLPNELSMSLSTWTHPLACPVLVMVEYHAGSSHSTMLRTSFGYRCRRLILSQHQHPCCCSSGLCWCCCCPGLVCWCQRGVLCLPHSFVAGGTRTDSTIWSPAYVLAAIVLRATAGGSSTTVAGPLPLVGTLLFVTVEIPSPTAMAAAMSP